MSETLTRPPKRIFVIGPMARDVMDSDGIPLAAHIPNIVEATRLVLQKLEHLFIAPRQRSYYNPITRHFSGVDLVNVAAATGIATANFYNFTKWVLREGGVFRRNPELEDIVLIRPRRILNVVRVIGMLQREFKQPRQHPDGTPVLDRDGNPIEDIPEMVVHHEGHPRGKYFVRRVGNHLLDYPTPISSLSVSRQFLAMGDYVKEFSLGAGDIDLVPFEQRLIDIYFQTLEDLARNTPFGCDWGRVRVLSVEDSIEYLRR